MLFIIVLSDCVWILTLTPSPPSGDNDAARRQHEAKLADLMEAARNFTAEMCPLLKCSSVDATWSRDREPCLESGGSLPAHAVQGLREDLRRHAMLVLQDQALLQGHRHGCTVFGAFTAGETNPIQSPADLRRRSKRKEKKSFLCLVHL